MAALLSSRFKRVLTGTLSFAKSNPVLLIKSRLLYVNANPVFKTKLNLSVRSFSRKAKEAAFEAKKNQVQIPLVGKFVLDNLERDGVAYKREIECTRSLFSKRHGGFRVVKALKPGSLGSLGQLLFSFKELSFLCLFGLYNMKPIAMFTPAKSEIVVLDNYAFGYVPSSYSKGMTVILREQPYNLNECELNFAALVEYVQVIALNEASVDTYASAVSVLTMFTMHASCFDNIFAFFQCCIELPSENMFLDDEFLNLVKYWGKISEAVYKGDTEFSIGVDIVKIMDLSLILMNSLESERIFVSPPPENEFKLRQMIRKNRVTEIYYLEPGCGGYNLVVTILSCKVLSAGNSSRIIREYLVCDESGKIELIARDEQVNLLRVGSKYKIFHASVVLYEGCAQVEVRGPGWIEEMIINV